MKLNILIKGLAATALLSCLGTGTALASHESPVPCDAGEFNDANNCMYVTMAGNTYNDGLDGNRDGTISAGAGTVSVDIYMNFDVFAVQGGGFNITYDTAGFSSSTWAWNATDFPGNCPTTPNTGEQTTCGTPGPGAMNGIQFDDFAGNGWGGGTGTQPAFGLVGTLTLVLTGLDGTFTVGLDQVGLANNTFPNCFAPGAQETGTPAGQCVPTDFYSLDITVQPVPLPAAAWLMMGGLGTLIGFGRKRVQAA